MITYVLGFLLLVLIAGVAAYLRVTFGKKHQPVGSRPVDPAGGFASGDQVRASLSTEAMYRAAGQVRPSLPAPAAPLKRKGSSRGRA